MIHLYSVGLCIHLIMIFVSARDRFISGVFVNIAFAIMNIIFILMNIKAYL